MLRIGRHCRTVFFYFLLAMVLVRTWKLGLPQMERPEPSQSVPEQRYRGNEDSHKIGTTSQIMVGRRTSTKWRGSGWPKRMGETL